MQNNHKTQSDSKTLLIILALIIILPILILTGVQKLPGKYSALAQCITDSGAKFYGADWCSHCQEQKLMFGNAVKKLPYVECTGPINEYKKNTADAERAIASGRVKTLDEARTVLGIKPMYDVCVEKNITGFPTWIFSDNSQLSGAQTLQVLAEKTNCTQFLK